MKTKRDVIKQFLENSSIGGLSYISYVKSPLIKTFWLFVVLSGFIASWFLINESFSEWEKSPVATTIDTFPIAEVKITVCPPR